MAYWISDTHWMCDKHLPSTKLSASFEKCHYNCGTVRPPFTVTARRGLVVTPRTLPPPPEVIFLPPPPEVIFLTPPPEAPEVVKRKKPTPVFSIPKTPRMKRLMVDDGGSGEEPSVQAKRRGATHRVECLQCRKALWRRPLDVTQAGAEFFCSTNHRSIFKRGNK